MRIIYPKDEGGIAIVIPAPHITDFEALAKKRTPSSKPYLIVDDSQIPSDRSQRNGWVADFSEPDGHGDSE